jgi:hypothetical protein
MGDFRAPIKTEGDKELAYVRRNLIVGGFESGFGKIYPLLDKAHKKIWTSPRGGVPPISLRELAAHLSICALCVFFIALCAYRQ